MENRLFEGSGLLDEKIKVKASKENDNVESEMDDVFSGNEDFGKDAVEEAMEGTESEFKKGYSESEVNSESEVDAQQDSQKPSDVPVEQENIGSEDESAPAEKKATEDTTEENYEEVSVESSSDPDSEHIDDVEKDAAGKQTSASKKIKLDKLKTQAASLDRKIKAMEENMDEPLDEEEDDFEEEEVSSEEEPMDEEVVEDETVEEEIVAPETEDELQEEAALEMEEVQAKLEFVEAVEKKKNPAKAREVLGIKMSDVEDRKRTLAYKIIEARKK